MAASEYVLECANGEVWEFNSGTSPVSLHTDPTGLEGAPFTFDDQKGVGQDGVTFKGRNDEPNLIGLDAKVGPVTPNTDEGAQLLARWRSSLGRGIELHTFRAITITGGTRFQRVRLGGVLTPPNLYQMRHSGVITHDLVSLRSDETWWRKDPQVQEFTSATIAGATMTNDGDVACWPHLVLEGPLTGLTLAWGTEQPVPLSNIGAGGTVTIQTDPEQWDIRDQNGTDLSWIGRRWYQPINPGTVPLVVSASGMDANTKITATVPQLFHGGH